MKENIRKKVDEVKGRRRMRRMRKEEWQRRMVKEKKMKVKEIII